MSLLPWLFPARKTVIVIGSMGICREVAVKEVNGCHTIPAMYEYGYSIQYACGGSGMILKDDGTINEELKWKKGRGWD